MTHTPPHEPPELAGRRILLGLTGSVACYKAAELCRLFTRRPQGRQSKAKASAISLLVSLLYSEHNVLVDTARSGISSPLNSLLFLAPSG